LRYSGEKADQAGGWKTIRQFTDIEIPLLSKTLSCIPIFQNNRISLPNLSLSLMMMMMLFLKEKMDNLRNNNTILS
jgi:hypothetical protein